MSELPSMIRVDGVQRLDFEYEEIADALGWSDFDNDDFGDHVDALRAYGGPRRSDRDVRQPEDAAEYIGFDLQPVQ